MTRRRSYRNPTRRGVTTYVSDFSDGWKPPASREKRRRPQHLRVVAQVRKLLAQHPRSAALQRPHHLRRRAGRPHPNEQVHVIRHHVLGYDPPTMLAANPPEQLTTPAGDPPAHTPAPTLRAPTPRAAPPSTPHPKCGQTGARTCTHPTKRHRQTPRFHTAHPPRFPRRLKAPVPSGRADGAAAHGRVGADRADPSRRPHGATPTRDVRRNRGRRSAGII
jgi:hypothetical protein